MKKLVQRSAIVAILALMLLAFSASFASAQGGGNRHIVRYGETLFSIGRTYGVNPYLIARVNGLRNPNHIYAGQRLRIPSGGDYWGGCGWNDCGNDWNNSNCGWNNCGNNWGNSNCGWNNCRDDAVNLPSHGWDNCGGWNDCGNNWGNSNCGWNNCDNGWDNVNCGGNCGGGNRHTVRYGETLYSIGRKYGVSPWAIANANGIRNMNRIYAGQVLRIPSGGGYYW